MLTSLSLVGIHSFSLSSVRNILWRAENKEPVSCYQVFGRGVMPHSVKEDSKGFLAARARANTRVG